MDLILDRLNSRVECIDQKLDQIKQNLIDKGLDINICNQNFSKLEIDNNKSLETQFKNANEKVLRSSNKPFVVGQIFKQNISSNFNSSRNNSNNNDTLASGTSSLNSHISSRSVRIDPERNRFSTYNQHSPISSNNSSNNNYNNRNNNYNNNRSNYNRHNDNHYSRRNNNFRTNTNSNHFNAYDWQSEDSYSINKQRIEIESDIPIYKVGQRVFLIDNFNINSNILYDLINILDKGSKFIPCLHFNHFHIFSNLLHNFDSSLASFNKYLYFNKSNNINNDSNISLDVSIEADQSNYLRQCDPIKCFLNKTKSTVDPNKIFISNETIDFKY